MISIIRIMRKLIFIIVLFFSTNLFAEVFNCELVYKGIQTDQKYPVLVDIGEENTDKVITTADIETGKFAGNILSEVQSVGKIYFDIGNPYVVGKEDTEVFFTAVTSYYKIGLFFPSYNSPSTIEITRMNGEGWEIFIADTYIQTHRLQTGVCE